MSVGKVFEWLVIAVIAIIGGKWALGLLQGAVDSPASPQTQNPDPEGFIGWPYGTGVVYLSPGIVGPQWGGPGGGEYPYGVPGTPSDPWVGPGAPPQARFPKANPIRAKKRLVVA
jgi:hypothetical protein